MPPAMPAPPAHAFAVPQDQRPAPPLRTGFSAYVFAFFAILMPLFSCQLSRH